MLKNFVTRAANRSERSRQWCALTQAYHVRFDDEREASLRGGDFGQVRLCLVSMGKHHMVQGSEASATSMPPTMKFLFQECGEATVRQGPRTSHVRSGQWCALRKDMPFEIEAFEHSRQLCVTLPCEVVRREDRDWRWWQQPRSFLRGPAQILHASTSASILCGGSLSQADCKQIGIQVAQLVDMTLRDRDFGPAPDPRESRRRAILDFIDRNLADTDLSVSRLAGEFACSVRTVHKLFEDEASTVVRTIWEKRLARCRDELVDPAMSARSITEIAHEWGFSDSQHFSRSFKNHYNSTPSEYRNRHLPA